jgi:serine O-acetyltransferase
MKITKDYASVFERDPAARGFWGYFEVLLTYSGFHAILIHRFNHFLHKMGIPLIPRFLSQVARLFTGIEIHPAAEIGEGFFIDHGMGVVIGETTIIGKNCTLFQGVTLGGTGKEKGKRHPTLKDNVVVGAGAKILGNIVIGSNSYIGANAVVLKDVPDNSTVVGIPGRIVRREGVRVPPGESLDHVHLPDPVRARLDYLQKQITCIEEHIKCVEKECKVRAELIEGLDDNANSH